MCVYYVEVSTNQRGGATLSLTEHLGSTQNNAHSSPEQTSCGKLLHSLLDLT